MSLVDGTYLKWK